MRNIAKKFKITMSLIDIETIKPRYKCFFGEDVELCIKVIDEDARPVDLTDVNAKVYYTCDGFEPLRQDNGITINEPSRNGTINILVNKKYLRLGVNTIRVALFDSDQEVLLQPCQVNCIETGIGDEHGDVIVNDDINVKDEFIRTNNRVNRVDNRLKVVEGDIPEIESGLADVSEELDNKANKSDIGTPLTAESVDKMTDTTKVYVNTTDGNWYSWNGENWIIGGIYNSQGIANKSINAEKTDFLSYYENTLNPIPKSTGCFWWYVDGTLTEKASANFNCHNRVLLKKGVTYFIGDVYGLASIVTKLDGSTKITSLSSVDGVFAGTYTPSEECYLYPTLYKISDPTKVVVQNSDTKFPLGDMVYLLYGNKYNVTVEGIDITELKNDITQIKSDLYRYLNDIHVKKDGSGDFTNIVSAITSITDSSYNNQYNIYLHDDEENIYEFMDDTILNNKGIWLPDGVNLIGVGSKKTIHCELPNNETDFRLQNVSTINMKYNNNLENLIITGKNVRYAVHDESSNAIKNWKRNVKNCEFEHKGSPSGKWTSLTAWGEGCSSGSESIFDNCSFITDSVTGAYGCHNNINFTKPSKHQFNNCRFLNKNPSGYSVKFGSMGSTQIDEIEFNNCRFTGKLHSGEELSNGCGLDFKIYGSGNDNVFCDFVSNLSKNKTTDFIGETITCLNNTGNTITKGTLVKTASYLSITPMTSIDSAGLFYGVAIEDIASGSFGLIKQKGYIEKGDLVANDGDYLGINSATFSVITSGIHVAKVVRGFIKLI